MGEVDRDRIRVCRDDEDEDAKAEKAELGPPPSLLYGTTERAWEGFKQFGLQ